MEIENIRVGTTSQTTNLIPFEDVTIADTVLDPDEETPFVVALLESHCQEVFKCVGIETYDGQFVIHAMLI